MIVYTEEREIHKSHNRAYNDNLCTEIETLNGLLAQIPDLRRKLRDESG